MRLIDADSLKERFIRTDAVVLTLLRIIEIINEESTINMADVTGEKVNEDR